ncbi:MAG TPA: toll/interleukin-1 receptor domain-containing protein [Thermoanaerobaculia bacterium]|nr:toll/interleukin-1 receptor domain-containing protein [Thermoanaerobaculia bacterium]
MPLMESLRRFFFGDDVFISYGRGDAHDYALALANELTRQKLSCATDMWLTRAGDELPPELRQALRRSTMLVIVGSDDAAASPSVKLEIEEFLGVRGHKPIHPIRFEDLDKPETPRTFEAASWYPLIRGIAVSVEDCKRLDSGQPSTTLITRIVNAEGFTSRNRRLRNVFGLTVCAIALVIAASAFVVQTLQRRAAVAMKQQAVAERKERRATSERLAAEAEKVAEAHPQQSLATAILAVQTFADFNDPPVAAAEQALWRALSRHGGIGLHAHTAEIRQLEISPDRRWMATLSENEALLWDLRRGCRPPIRAPCRRTSVEWR